MRWLVLSDVHGQVGALERVLELHPTADVIFLGDGLREVEDAADRYPNRRFILVPGNCDWSSRLPATRVELLGGKRFFITHGHKYGVKYDLYSLQLAAKERQADVVLFGHTHTPYETYEDGMYFLNPGSLGYGESYGYVDITPAGILTGTARLPR